MRKTFWSLLVPQHGIGIVMEYDGKYSKDQQSLLNLKCDCLLFGMSSLHAHQSIANQSIIFTCLIIY
jgi:hypothetical protein